MANDFPCWLDPIIEEQAKYYGMSVEKHGKLIRDVATYLEDHNESEDKYG